MIRSPVSQVPGTLNWKTGRLRVTESKSIKALKMKRR